MAAGNFRDDLYYRLNVVALHLPSLSERREDIPLLRTTSSRSSRKNTRKQFTAMRPRRSELLVSAPWPGNVRQLYNVVEQAVALCTTHLIPLTLCSRRYSTSRPSLASFEDAAAEVRARIPRAILQITDGNVTQAARLAKRNRTEFYKLLQRHQLEPRLFKS
jgi:two-component system response regulator GlrR